MGARSFKIAISVNSFHIFLLLVRNLPKFYKIIPSYFCQDKTLKKQIKLTHINKKFNKGENGYGI